MNTMAEAIAEQHALFDRLGKHGDHLVGTEDFLACADLLREKLVEVGRTDDGLIVRLTTAGWIAWHRRQIAMLEGKST